MFRRLSIVLAVCVLSLASPVRADEAEEKAAKIVGSSGRLTRDENRPGKPIVAIDLRSSGVTLSDLKVFATLPHLTALDIRGSYNPSVEVFEELAKFKSLTTLGLTLNASGLKQLANLPNLPNLTTLDLVVNGLTDADMKLFATVRSVRTLDLLHNTEVTDTGLKELAALKNLTTLTLPPRTITDRGIKELAPLTNLTELALYLGTVTEDGLKELAPLTNLTLLHVRGRAVGAGVGGLGKLKNLTSLAIGLTDDGLRELPALKGLTRLYLNGYYTITDDGLKHLAAVQTLNDLVYYVGPKVTPVGFKHIAALSNLKTLTIHGDTLNDVGLKELAALPNLIVLDVSMTRVASAGMKDVAKMKNLSVLGLGMTAVQDEGLRELAALTKLTQLNLMGAPVTDTGVKELQKSLPKCKIMKLPPTP